MDAVEVNRKWIAKWHATENLVTFLETEVQKFQWILHIFGRDRMAENGYKWRKSARSNGKKSVKTPKSYAIKISPLRGGSRSTHGCICDRHGHCE
jgi:hypothetical protein